jgi:hypothetical protein
MEQTLRAGIQTEANLPEQGGPNLIGLWSAHKTDLPHIVGGGADQPELCLWSDLADTW